MTTNNGKVSVLQTNGRLHSRVEEGYLCIASKRPKETAETFIRAHMCRLPFPLRVLHGNPPHTDDRIGFLYWKGFPGRLWKRVQTRRFWSDPSDLRDEVLARYFQSQQIAVVLAEYGDVGVHVLRACQRVDVPLVVHFHGHDAHSGHLIGSYQKGYQELFRYAAGIVAVSREMERELINLGAPAEKVVYIPYWVDPDQFAGATPGEAGPRFLAVGRFVETKAPHLTVRAFAEVVKAVPGASLTMVGDGPLLGPCVHLARSFGIADAIEFTGARDHAFVCEQMRQSRAFVQHSVRCQDGTCEGTPVAILEAQAIGLPVVATRHAGIKDVVVEGETGFLVDECDTARMAEHMIQLGGDAELAGRLGRAGRERILTHFGEQQTTSRLVDLIARVSRGRLRSERVDIEGQTARGGGV